MKLKRLQIERAHWPDAKGKFSGEAMFDAPVGKVTIGLDDRAAREILFVCASELARAATEIARLMLDDLKADLRLEGEKMLKEVANA